MKREYNSNWWAEKCSELASMASANKRMAVNQMKPFTSALPEKKASLLEQRLLGEGDRRYTGNSFVASGGPYQPTDQKSTSHSGRSLSKSNSVDRSRRRPQSYIDNAGIDEEELVSEEDDMKRHSGSEENGFYSTKVMNSGNKNERGSGSGSASTSYKRGRFTEEEDLQLIRAVEKSGCDWDAIMRNSNLNRSRASLMKRYEKLRGGDNMEDSSGSNKAQRTASSNSSSLPPDGRITHFTFSGTSEKARKVDELSPKGSTRKRKRSFSESERPEPAPPSSLTGSSGSVSGRSEGFVAPTSTFTLMEEVLEPNWPQRMFEEHKKLLIQQCEEKKRQLRIKLEQDAITIGRLARCTTLEIPPDSDCRWLITWAPCFSLVTFFSFVSSSSTSSSTSGLWWRDRVHLTRTCGMTVLL
mgnify:CR=1 FL=1